MINLDQSDVGILTVIGAFISIHEMEITRSDYYNTTTQRSLCK